MRLGNVAVAVPVWLVTMSLMLLYVTLTRTGDMFALGQLNPARVIGVVDTVKLPLPCLVVGNCTCPLVVDVDLTSPRGSLLWLGVTQPLVIVTVEERVALPPVLPAPATSPDADKVDVLVAVLRVAVAVGVPTKCRPPVRLVDVALAVAVVAANAGTAARASAISDSTAIMPIFLIKVFLLYLVGFYRSLST